MFALKKRFYQHANNKFLIILELVCLNIFFGCVYIYFANHIGVHSHVTLDQTNEEQQYYLEHTLTKYNITTQE